MTKQVGIMPGDAEAPRNQWYVIAFSDDVEREPVSRRIMGDPVVLYRREDGSPVALFDRCPHRGMRLSNGGKLIDDAIQCNYHGLEFGPDGACRSVPSGGPIPKQMCVHSYPIVEIWNWLWIWPGDPAKADPALIPDHHMLGLTDPALNAYPGPFLELECNYLHAYENLLDATHISYLHHGFVDTGNVAAHPYREEIDGDTITTIRDFMDEPVHPYAKISYELRGDRTDRELRITSIPATVCVVSERYREKGVDAPRELLVRLVMAVTPASSEMCYQFVTAVRTLPTEREPLIQGLVGFLSEDQVALADVQRLFASLTPEQRAVEASVRTDTPVLRARRVLENLIRDEAVNAEGVAA